MSLTCKTDTIEMKGTGFEEVHLSVPDQTRSSGSPDAVIRVKDISLEVFEHTSDSLLRRLMKAVQEC